MTQAAPARGHDYSLHYRAFHTEEPGHVQEMTAAQKGVLTTLLGATHGGPSLDIGCGMGFTVLAMRELGYSAVEGVDVDPGQIEASRRLGANGTLIADTAAYLRDRPAAYQLVTMFDVLEHVPVADQIDTLRAVYAALRPGGRLIVQVPNATFIMAPRWRYIDYTHYASFTDHSLNYVLRNAGFGKVEMPPSQKVYRPSLRGFLFRRAERKAFRSRLRRWIVRWCWEQVIRAELPFENVRQLWLDPNLTAVATKDGGP